MLQSIPRLHETYIVIKASSSHTMLIWCGRLKIPWIGKTVISRFLLLILNIISPSWTNWNTVPMAQNNNEQTSALSWGSIYAFALLLRLGFEAIHIHTDRKVITNTNAWAMQTQTHARRHYTATVNNQFTTATLMQYKYKRKSTKGVPALCKYSPTGIYVSVW